MQEDSKEGLAKYYQTHLSELEELQELAVEYSKDPAKEKIDSFIREVKIFVENELQKQNVKFLRVTQKAEG